MNAAVLLVLAFMAPDRSVQTQSLVLPSLVACRAAEREFLARTVAAVSGAPIDDGKPPLRWAACLTLPVHGADA